MWNISSSESIFAGCDSNSFIPTSEVSSTQNVKVTTPQWQSIISSELLVKWHTDAINKILWITNIPEDKIYKIEPATQQEAKFHEAMQNYWFNNINTRPN